MEDLPIDIHYNKLSDWLVKRRHCQQKWHDAAFQIRQKINNAIQDMPVHEGITQLLQGTYINYFHCLKIVDILKDTESSSKNIFGRYSSQRMKDWQEIVRLYEVDCVYLAEAAQMLTRNVNFEIPALKKQVAKCKKTQQECTRKEDDYNRMAGELRNKHKEDCKNIGIEGKNVRRELLALASELPQTYADIAVRCRCMKPAIEYYSKFSEFLNASINSVCALLLFICENGNATTFEWRTGKPPTSVVESIISLTDAAQPVEKDEDDIDWGAIDFGDEGESELGESEVEPIDYGEGDIGIEIAEEGNADLTIDWNLEEQKQYQDDDVARGKDALSVLDNPATRFQFLDELCELEAFLEQRKVEQSSEGSDVILISLYQSAPYSVELSDEGLSAMLSAVQLIKRDVTSSKLQQLISIRNSPRYVDRLTEKIVKVLEQSEKMAASARLMIIKAEEASKEAIEAEPKIGIIREKTKQLKKQVEKEISKKYNNRIVNIMGEINMI